MKFFSRIALGTWTFAGDNIWGRSTTAECGNVIGAALDMGINFFDTSPNYGDGRSEELLGKALKNKQDALIGTKFKIDGKTPELLEKSVTESLRRLKRDRLDLIQIHWPGISPEETVKALHIMSGMKKRGMVREIGVCNFGHYDLEDAADFPVISNQIPYNLLWRTAEEKIIPESRKKNLRILAYSVFQQGLLNGNYSDPGKFPAGRKRTKHFQSDRAENSTREAIERLIRMSLESGRSLRETALLFVLSNREIDTLILGARTVKQLTENLKTAEKGLTREESEALIDATAELKRVLGPNPDMFLDRSRVRY